MKPTRSGVESEHVFGGEDHDTGRIQAEQLRLESFPAVGDVVGAGEGSPAWNRLDHVRQHGHGDEEPGDVVEHEGRGAGLRVLERPPHSFTDVLGRGKTGSGCGFFVRFRLIVGNPLHVFPLPVAVILLAAVADDVLSDAEEGELVVERGDAFVFRVVHRARPVVAENMSEDVRIAVEEILSCVVIEEELLLVGSQQGLRIFLQSVTPRFEDLSANVDPQLPIGAGMSVLRSEGSTGRGCAR